MAVTFAEMEEQRACVAYDIEYDGNYMNMLSSEGYAHALYQVLNLAPQSRSSTGRSKLRPEGNRDAPSVAAANVLVARCAILLLIASARGIFWVLEQPRGSLLEAMPVMQKIFKLVRVFRQHIRMGDFAAPTEKGTWLYSNKEIISGIVDFKPAKITRKPRVDLVEKYTDSSGRLRIKGSKFLKGSQAYTVQFGRALARLRSRHKKEVVADARSFIPADGKQGVIDCSGQYCW